MVPQLVPGVSKHCKSNLERPGFHIGFCWQRWLTQSWRWISSRNLTCSTPSPPPPTRCSLHLLWTPSWMWILHRDPGPHLSEYSTGTPLACQPSVQQVGTVKSPSPHRWTSCSRSSQVSSTQVMVPPTPNTGCSTSLRRRAALNLPDPAAWIQTSSRPPRRSSASWNWQVLYAGQTVPGLLLFTW